MHGHGTPSSRQKSTAVDTLDSPYFLCRGSPPRVVTTDWGSGGTTWTTLSTPTRSSRSGATSPYGVLSSVPVRGVALTRVPAFGSTKRRQSDYNE